MLAATFTRKAAGEILERLLKKLAEAAQNEAAATALYSRLEVPLPSQPEDELARQLQRLCSALNEVAISTIDAFFGTLLRCYRHELGLPEEIRVLDEEEPAAEALQEEAVRRLLTRTPEEQLRPLLAGLHKQDAQRSLQGNLLKNFDKAHAVFVTSRPEAWEPGYELRAELNANGLQSLLDRS